MIICVYNDKFGVLEFPLYEGSEEGFDYKVYCIQSYLAFLSEPVSKP